MGATTGIQPIGTYAGTAESSLIELLGLIPNPDVAPAQGGGGFLDEMSPAAAAQLRVEIFEILGGEPAASGTYEVTSGDVSGTKSTIDTGLDVSSNFSSIAVVVTRAGVDVTADAVVTDGGDGTFTVEDGAATYTLTAGDVINWYVVV